jgi:hypothetical protein
MEYKQLGKDGVFHMASVLQGLLHSNMPWDWEDSWHACVPAALVAIDGETNQIDTSPLVHTGGGSNQEQEKPA